MLRDGIRDRLGESPEQQVLPAERTVVAHVAVCASAGSTVQGGDSAGAPAFPRRFPPGVNERSAAQPTSAASRPEAGFERLDLAEEKAVVVRHEDVVHAVGE